ncbi:MAG: chemotaxis protein CheX [Oscillospiraceae bacterium]
MSEKIFTSLANATQEVLHLMLGVDAVAGGKSTESLTLDSDEIVVCIGLTGDASEEVSYYYPKETALEFVRIMSGMEVDKVDEFVMSAVSEISNIISGSAATELSTQEIVCDILPPQVTLESSGERVTDDSFAQNTHAIIKTLAGNMVLSLTGKRSS